MIHIVIIPDSPFWNIFCFHLHLVKLKFFVLKKKNKQIKEVVAKSEQNQQFSTKYNYQYYGLSFDDCAKHNIWEGQLAIRREAG